MSDLQSSGLTADQFPPGTIAPQEHADSIAPDDLPEELQNAIRDLACKMAGRDKWLRRWEVQKVRKARFFWRGNQRLVWDGQNGQWQIPYQGGQGTTSGSDAADRPKYLDTTNIYQAYGKSVIAALTQNLPSVRFEPDDPKAPLDIQTAAAAENLRKTVERNNDMPRKQVELGRLFWTDGRVISYTHFVSDKQKFGMEKNPQTGEEAPAGQEVIDFYGVLEGKVPLTLQEFSQLPYVSISVEEDIVNLKARYPDVADKITAGATGMGEDQYERIARLSVMQGGSMLTQSGDSLSHLVTHQRIWFRPCAFLAVEDDDIQQQLMEKFPDGCAAVFSGDTFCEARAESMDDCLAICRPLPGDGQDTPSLGDVLISVQERINDLLDIQIEGYELGIGKTYVDSKIIDVKALQDQKSIPADYVPVINPNAAVPLPSYFYKEPSYTVSPDMLKHIDDLKGSIAQFLTGAQPAMFGGSMEDQKTASGYAMARDQAMGQMGVIWRPIKSFYAAIMAQSVKCASNNRTKDIVSGSGTSATLISMSELKGNIHCFPDTDENFPESWTQKRAVFMQLMQAAAINPAIAQLLLQPDNQYLFKQYMGLDDMKVPGADSRNKQLAEIDELLASEPIPPQLVAGPDGQLAMDPQTGQPQIQPPQSSVPIDPEYDDNALEYEECKAWINSDAGRTAKITKPNGFENVRLHGLAHKAALQAQQAPPPPSPEMLKALAAVHSHGAAQGAAAMHAAHTAPPAGAPPPGAPPQAVAA